jgi:hypothetical protein
VRVGTFVPTPKAPQPYHTFDSWAMSTMSGSAGWSVRAKLHDMSTNEAGATQAGALLEDAIALVLLDEQKAQRYTAIELQERSGVKSRVWTHYLISRTREIPTSAWVAIGGALGMSPQEVIDRASRTIGALSPDDLALLVKVQGRTRVDLMRQLAEGGGVADPRGRARDDEDDGPTSYVRRSA